MNTKIQTIPCLECGQKFTAYKSNHRKFCCHKCSTIWSSKHPNKGVFKPGETRGIRFAEGHLPWNKGIRFEAVSGPNHYRWTGKTKEHELARKSPEYKEWRRKVYERDGYRCVLCGDNTSGNLEADHIKPFAFFPELRFVVSNGRTLCKPCHKNTPTYGVKSQLTYEKRMAVYH